MRKTVLMFVFAAVLLLLSSVSASAAPISAAVEYVDVEGTRLDPTGQSTLREEFRRGDDMNVRVRISAGELVEDATLTVFISGYEFDTISDSVSISRLQEDRALTRELDISLPDDMEDGEYKMRVMLTDRDSETLVQEYDIALGLDRNELSISDVIFYDSQEVRAGDSLYAIIRARNMGYNDLDDVRASFEIPELGISTADYMSKLEEGRSKSSPELFLRIPSDAEAGTYDAELSLSYRGGRYETTRNYEIEVVEDEPREPDEKPKTEISVPKDPQSVTVGETAVYPITVKNLASSSRTYTFNVESGEEWGEFKLDPSSMVTVEGNSEETVYLRAKPKIGIEGRRSVVLSVSDGEDTKQIALQADVEPRDVEEPDGAFRRGLEIGLIVLVVLLVVVGLVVAFTRLASREDDEDEDDEETQTYY